MFVIEKKPTKILVTGGYKGYGLAMMVEVLCGILSGANFGPNVRTWKDFEKVANLVSKHSVTASKDHNDMAMSINSSFNNHCTPVHV